ncbi:MAG TPA: DUF4249 domain-containing protein [Flavisolibacter sp.]|jgi:hypothetical protein|nr:DUF4249 domain-containing protein [Flavisolibacter sp.]
MKRINLLFLLLVVIAGCRDRYELPLRDNDVSLLVVEGVLNVGGPTNITLSRTLKINDDISFKPELNAQLTVEDKSGNSFPLTTMGPGQYNHTQVPMVVGEEYRLRIRTANNKEYLSNYVTAVHTPDIDSISWRKENEGVRVYANSHDPSNNTRYYKWNYDETWEIRSYYPAEYKWLGDANIIYFGLYNYQCWKYEQSSNILVGTTAQLQADVLSEAPLTFINPGSEKLSVRYSILVRQQSLTKAAYEYFSLMKKNTESLGTIFDPQPSELRGNIHCVSDPQEDVIGYLTASSFTEKRLFITASETQWRYFQDCQSIEVANHPDSIKLWVPTYLPYSANTEGLGIKSYNMAYTRCVDCTARGGNLSRPSYW